MMLKMHLPNVPYTGEVQGWFELPEEDRDIFTDLYRRHWIERSYEGSFYDWRLALDKIAPDMLISSTTIQVVGHGESLIEEAVYNWLACHNIKPAEEDFLSSLQ